MYKKLVLLFSALLIVLFSDAQSFNYTITNGNLESTYSWIDCSPTDGGAEVQDNQWEQNAGLGDKKDDGYTMIAWPFAFQFYDSYYFAGDKMSVCTNGFIRLDGIADDDASNVNDESIDYSLDLGEVVCLAMEDCGFESENSHLYYKTTGSAPNRVFTVEMHQIEIRFNEDKYADVQVSFYETSNKIVLKFGKENINYSAYMGIHSGNTSYWSSYYNQWQDLNGATQNRWRAYTPPAKAFHYYSDLTITQASNENLGPSINNPILRLEYDIDGGGGSLDLESIIVTALNTDNADVGAVRLFHTTEAAFNTKQQVGSLATKSGSNYTFNNLSYDIPGGVSYFWITYDINSTATSGNTVDGKILAGNILNAGILFPYYDEDPNGNREISFFKWDGSTSTNWSVASNWNTNSIPKSTDNVYIPSSPSNQPHLLSGKIGNCKNLTIETGAKLTIENSKKNLKIYGSIINDGTLDVTGSNNILLFASNGTIEGSGSFNLAKFRLSNSSTYTLYKNINVYKLLLDNGCTINIGDYNVSCNNIFNSKSGSTITIGSGSISATASLKLDGNFIAGKGTVIYAGTNGQVISNVTYYNLKVKVTGNSRRLKNVSNNFQNLEIYSETSGKAKLSSSLQTKGNITVGANCILDLNSRDITIEKDFTDNGSTIFGNNTVTFNGIGSSHIYGNSNFYNLVINKSSGDVYIESGDNRITNNLTLTNGIVFANNIPLVVEAGCTTTGGSETSYVDGKLKKIGNDAYLFHVGDFRKYAPLKISAPASATSEFTVYYHNNAYVDSNVLSPLSKVSEKEYWDLDNTGIPDTVNVTLYWKAGESFSGIGDLSDLRIAHYNDSIWESLGKSITAGNINEGSITVKNISSFSPFTFGTLNNVTNPLPVSLINFDIEKIDNTAHIQWTTASEINNSHFIIQRSLNGENIENIGEVNGAGNSNSLLKYSFIDNNPPQGIVYYRLQQYDFDGKSEIFEWKSLFFGNEGELNIYPIPNSNGILTLTYSDINADAQVSIISMDGKLVFDKQIMFSNGEAALNFNLPKGCYVVKMLFVNELFTRRLIVK